MCPRASSTPALEVSDGHLGGSTSLRGSSPCLFQHPGSFRCQLKLTCVLWDTPSFSQLLHLICQQILGIPLPKIHPEHDYSQPTIWVHVTVDSFLQPLCLYSWPHLAVAQSPWISAQNPLMVLHPTQEVPQSFQDPKACHVGPHHLPDHPAPGAASSLLSLECSGCALLQGLCTNRASEGTSAQMLTGLIT